MITLIKYNAMTGKYHLFIDGEFLGAGDTYEQIQVLEEQLLRKPKKIQTELSFERNLP